MNSCSATSARTSVRAAFLNSIAASFIQFLIMMVLARLLIPSQYGVYALSVVIAALSVTFVCNVSERTLVVDSLAHPGYDRTPVITLLALSSALVALGISAFLVRHGGLQLDLGITAVVLLSAVLGSVAIVPRVALRRDLRFNVIAFSETLGMILGLGVVTTTLAVAGWGSYALAAGNLAQTLCIAGIIRARARPAAGRLALGPKQIIATVRAIRKSAGISAAEVLNGQVAPLIIGIGLGSVALGLFNRAYSLVQIPIQLLIASIIRVMISVLFTRRENDLQFHATSRSLVRISAAIISPVAAGIAGAAHNFVSVVYGADWLGIVMFLPLLVLSAWAVMMGTVFATITEAKRAFKAKTRLQLVSTFVLAALALTGAQFSLVAAVFGIAVSSCLYLMLTGWLASRFLEVPLRSVISWLIPGVVLAVPCFLSVKFIDTLVIGPVTLVLCLQIAACGLIVITILVTLFPGLARQLLDGIAPSGIRFIPGLGSTLQK